MMSAVRIAEHVRSVIDQDGAVLLDLKRGRYFGLNGAGVAVWRRLEAGVSPAVIGAEFADRYAAKRGVGDEVSAFIASLRRAELIDGGD